MLIALFYFPALTPTIQLTAVRTSTVIDRYQIFREFIVNSFFIRTEILFIPRLPDLV
uniref:Uncharacterized protein n=1 Tax=Utricularia reniformis TaxID=192314 RepID=A0A1Y0B2Q6_9LAMI|nr:hypothetical protein AEK19_MT1489 [Utricularia reniformis]ART31680.1 hypothetical protein AEK19_MT1489 [Utricularia reniformis]